ncbi:hypothetical protein [Dapis sp. BLCC M229]|uniref:hypothetical protein n=1 Tax=Dapis sp. BLCC M229 TaxID=3400188 RepID=UPI003CF378A2
MKRTVSWLAKLFVSSVVALALVVTLGVQQAQAKDTGYCCTGEVRELFEPGEACTVEYTEKYPFHVATLINDNFEQPTELDVIYGDYGHTKAVSLDPFEIKQEPLFSFEKEQFVLKEGGPVFFECY